MFGIGELLGVMYYIVNCMVIIVSIIVVIDICILCLVIQKDFYFSWWIIQVLVQCQCVVEFDIIGYYYGLIGMQWLFDYLFELVGDCVWLVGEMMVMLKVSKKMIVGCIGMMLELFLCSLC